MIFFRYIFIQLLIPYAMGVVILTFVLSLDSLYQLINLLVSKGGGSSVFWLVLYRMPQFFASTLPLAVVIAVIVVMARLSMDLEITAMRTMGSGIRTFVQPVLVFGLLITGMTYFVTLWAQPMGYAVFEKEKMKLLRSHASKQIQPKVINQDFNGKILYVDGKSNSEQLLGVFIADRELKKHTMVIMADHGKIALKEEEQEMKLKLFDGTIHLMPGNPEIHRTVTFKALDYIFDAPGVPEVNSSIWGVPTLELLNLERKKSLLELLLRLTTPLAGVAFALASITLGITDPRSGRTGSYLRAVILVIVYYILWLGAKNLSSRNIVSPHILWAPPAIILTYGFYTLYKLHYNLERLPAVFQHLWSSNSKFKSS